MLFSSTFISIIEVLMVLVPALLSVAYVTVAERKTMASMQRRVGPNSVGYYGTLQALNKLIQSRSFHTSRSLNNSPKHNKKRKSRKTVIKPVNNTKLNSLLSLLPELSQTTIFRAIKGLYRDRVAPVTAFVDKILATCPNILDPQVRDAFLDQWGNLGGIYVIQFKHNPLIFYIGRTTNFRSIFNAHVRFNNKDKFHLFARLVGWENFNLHIVKLCPKSKQGQLENFYLQKYLPLLNSTLISHTSETSITQSLSDLLESRKIVAGKPNLAYLPPPGGEICLPSVRRGTLHGLSIAIWVYKMYDRYIDKTPVAKYDSISQASNISGNDRGTIISYLNSNVPLKGLLYSSNPIIDFEQ